MAHTVNDPHDVIIVGSGAGGAMAAWVLTKAGGKVLMLEAGRDYDPAEAPMLADLHSAHPEIRIEVESSSAIRDLGAGEADIALRGTAREAPAGVVGRRLCRNDWTLYCSVAYADRHGGVPHTKAELRNHAFVGGGGGSLWRAYQAFLRAHDLESQVAIHHPSSSGLLASVPLTARASNRNRARLPASARARVRPLRRYSAPAAAGQA